MTFAKPGALLQHQQEGLSIPAPVLKQYLQEFLQIDT